MLNSRAYLLLILGLIIVSSVYLALNKTLFTGASTKEIDAAQKARDAARKARFVAARIAEQEARDPEQKVRDAVTEQIVASQKARDADTNAETMRILRAEVAKKGEKVLVEIAGVSWHELSGIFLHRGTVILTDGTIYKFSARYIEQPMNEMNPDSSSSLILPHITKIDDISNISEEDLKMIKKYAAEVKEKLENRKNFTLDAGNSYTEVYDYTGNRKVLIHQYFVKTNTDETADKLRQIISKYFHISWEL